MKYSFPYSILILTIFCQLNCSLSAPKSSKAIDSMVHGVSFVAPPRPYDENTFEALTESHVNYIAVIPYGFMKPDDSNVYYDPNGKQWWGERPEGVRKSILDAHSNNIKVMLKPSVYMWKSWTGDVQFETQADLDTWNNTYRNYILFYAKMADSLSVELFCIGNEFKQLTISHPDLWRTLISDIRKIYGGQLTYASNWDEYNKVLFWDDLDFIGVNAYFPLSEEKHPSKKTLINAWKPIETQIQKVASKYGKPVLFTEYGYMSVDHATHETWQLEKDREVLVENEQLQADAYQALFETFYNTDYWHGGFVWKWYPYEGRRMTFRTKDYTPQNKLGIKTLSHWFSKK